uniref:CSON000635 protein n=1 Tax=Culicoides sonorensis TaxID=179676 RepID=A0A336K475_CULSO
MRLILYLLLFSCISSYCYAIRNFWRGRYSGGALGQPSKVYNYKKHLLSSANEEKWFTQQLDHFDPTNLSKTWQQRYYVNSEYYQEGGPVFLMIGGEGEATAKWMHEGAWIKYAKKFNALCFQLEHRFYGKSHPTDDLSTENLIYLNSEQALADLANFITAMNEKYQINTSNTVWIAFGGSYPGSLAAWLREKYGHLVHGAISSSGPLLAKIDFNEYFEVVTNSLATYSQDCVTAVQRSIVQVETLLKHMIGQRSINEKFKLCDPVEKSITNTLDIANLFENLAGNFAGVVQYNKDNSPHSKVTIDDLCNIMVNTTIGAPVSRLAEVNNMMLNIGNETCLDFKYDKMIDELKNVSWDAESSEGGRQWTYQTCTEFGFYQTSEDPSATFGDRFPVEFFVKQCTDIFGPKFNNVSLSKATTRTNIMYGALNPQTTNVLYVHGSIDPWHALGLTKTIDKNMPTIYIEGTAHCANMYEPSENDLPQLKQARIQIETYIENLLKTESNWERNIV